MSIPKETISRILLNKLNENGENFSINTETVESVTKYTDVLIEEMVLRSLENKENIAEATPTLDVDDLEKIIGLLLLDM
ncbi:hypothetical protein KAFR_0B00900 [Kazachstania africana CBS 2517]|uniref:Uncharacterized protein n=1 Tax=Kazachstania africana (strain ATCC 22294 / BCRC 22015 / CBS 2517 / CECT 1963 / NBRC 1671 / NRRL Y-8276) TaxID=1071382 RepID=H2APT8_KAZAF|nr:hypothetical protein KAFR_0B00900 [Kazachstania africana CBS 2517]CCF56388.1 hypothetical protein KAFR_0B00900 [Kazachstania africana CBS 2517]